MQHVSLRFPTFLHPALFLFILCLAQPVDALTLGEALRSASQNNEDVRAAAARVARARAVRRGALAELLPSATVTYSKTLREVESVRIVNDERVVLTPRESETADISLELELFDFANIPLVQSAQKDLQAERFDSAEVHRSLLFEVAATYFQTLTAERLAAAADTRRQVAQQFVNDTRDKVNAGLANRNELTRLELELASAELVKTQTENTLTKARLLLGYLINRDVAEPLVEPANPAVNTEREHANHRPDFRSAILRTEAARARVRQSWFEWLPDLGLRFTHYAPDIDAASRNNNDWLMVATFRWELFQPTLIADIGLQNADYHLAREEELALKRQLILDTRVADADVESAQAALNQAEVRLRVAEQNAEEVRERFRLGLATAFEQADANVSEFEARAGLAQQRFALQQAHLERVRADGYGPELIYSETE